MTGSVKKYGPTWRIRWDAGFKPDGTRIQRSEGGFTTKKEAVAALDEIRVRARQGQVQDARDTSVASWLDSWLESKRSLSLDPPSGFEQRTAQAS